MKILLAISLVIPAALAFFGAKTHRYPFNVAMIAALIVIALVAGYRMGANVSFVVAGLAVSVVADYFMAHKGFEREHYYLLGIGGFFLAHALFLCHVVGHFQARPAVVFFGAALLTGYGVYLALRVLPRVSGAPMKIAVAAYAAISAVALALSLGYTGLRETALETWLFAAGIAMIVLSDTFIAEADFVGNRAVSLWILPTYFACHLLLVGSLIAGM